MVDFENAGHSGGDGGSKREYIRGLDKIVVAGAIGELAERLERFGILKFPGLTPSAYDRLKQEEQDPYFSATPTDEIIARCRDEGIKIRMSNSGQNVCVYPKFSDNDDDTLFPRHLDPSKTENEDLRRLIELSVIYKEL